MSAQANVAAATGPTRFQPEVGRSVPASVVRLILAVIIVALCITIVGWQLLLAVALVFALATFIFPTTPAAWLLAALLAALSLGAYGELLDWKFLVVLVGAHLLHMSGMMLRWLPISGPVQLRVLGRMLRAFLIVQIPAQLASVVILTLLAGRSVVSTLSSPAFGIVAAVGLVLLVVAVIAPIVRSGAAR